MKAIFKISIILVVLVLNSEKLLCQRHISHNVKIKVEKLLKDLTIEEKVNLLHGFGSGEGEFGDKNTNLFGVKGIERLNIPDVYMGHGITGARLGRDTTVYATYMCTPIAMGCSWDKYLYSRVATGIAKELRAYGQDLNLGPTINIIRHPLGGRNWESISEDPYLTSKFVIEYVKSMQNNGVICGPKHFAVNNQETNRFDINNEVDERTLREIYLPSFEAAVKEGGALNIMGAYNRLNGEFMCQNRHMLTDILRKEWGFEGFVLSDFSNGVRSTLKAARAGLNIEMHGAKFYGEPMLDYIQKGELKESCIDSLLRDYLCVIYEFNINYRDRYLDYKIHSAENIALAKEAAQNSAVLLKNNGILPLDKSKKIAIIGPNAKGFDYNQNLPERTYYLQGGGSGRMYYFPNAIVSPYEGIRNFLNKDEIPYAIGCKTPNLYPQNKSPQINDYEELIMIDKAVEVAKSADVVILSIGMCGYNESEGWDRKTAKLPGYQDMLVRRIAEVQKNIVVVINTGSYVDMSNWEDKVAAILFAPYCGEQIGNAIAEILYGEVCPSGRLSFTWPTSLEDYPTCSIFRGKKYTDGKISNRYSEGIYVGYRWFEKHNKIAKYPFGYGLSYTSFEFKNISINKKSRYDYDIDFDVVNVGDCKGKVVPQLYVAEQTPKTDRPIKELKGFTKVELLPGETKRITIPLNFRSFAYYNDNKEEWEVTPGKFKIMIQENSIEKNLETEIDIK